MRRQKGSRTSLPMPLKCSSHRFYFTYSRVQGALSRWCWVVDSYQMTVQRVWIGFWSRSGVCPSFCRMQCNLTFPNLYSSISSCGVWFNMPMLNGVAFWCVLCLFVTELFNITLWLGPLSRTTLDFGLKPWYLHFIGSSGVGVCIFRR